MMFEVAKASSLYSTFLEDLATMGCFLTYQETKVLLRKVQNLVVDLRSRRYVA